MTDATADELEKDLDRHALTQALRDFDIANERVIDLSERLASAYKELADTRAQLEKLKAEHEDLRRTHDAMQGSAAFRLASRIWALRNRVGI